MASTLKRTDQIAALKAKLKRAREGLRWVKRDCEICDWHCHVCGVDQGAKDLDLYAEVKRALKETR